jgi:hypothetical protein
LRSIGEIGRNQRLKNTEDERLSAIDMLRELFDDHCELTRFLRLAHGVLIDFATWRRPVSSRIGLTKANASSGCAA